MLPRDEHANSCLDRLRRGLQEEAARGSSPVPNSPHAALDSGCSLCSRGCEQIEGKYELSRSSLANNYGSSSELEGYSLGSREQPTMLLLLPIEW